MNWNTTTMATRTSRRWTNPPAVYAVNMATAHNTSRISAIVQSMAPSFSVLPVLGFVPVKGRADNCQVRGHPLQAVLAADAGCHLRHSLEAGGRNGLGALLARAVSSIAQTLQGSGEAIGAFREQRPGGKGHFATLIDLADIHLVGQLDGGANGGNGVGGRGPPAHVAHPLYHPIQLDFQCLLDLVHRCLPLGRAAGSLSAIPTRPGARPYRISSPPSSSPSVPLSTRS